MSCEGAHGSCCVVCARRQWERWNVCTVPAADSSQLLHRFVLSGSGQECADSAPEVVGGFSNSLVLHQLARHGREHVVIAVDRLQPIGSELAFHGQSDQELFPHQAETDLLHGAAVGEELHFHRMLLPYAPRAPAGLPQSVQGIAGFVEEDGRELQQVESGLDQLGMADDDVDSALQLLAVPGLAFMSGHAGPEHASANPLGSQQLVQTGVNVVLAGVDGEHLTFTPARKLSLDFLYDSSLFRISLALI